jgi:hypothetical protein
MQYDFVHVQLDALHLSLAILLRRPVTQQTKKRIPPVTWVQYDFVYVGPHTILLLPLERGTLYLITQQPFCPLPPPPRPSSVLPLTCASWVDAVDSQPLWPILSSSSAHHAHHSMLGGSIATHTWHATHTCSRCGSMPQCQWYPTPCSLGPSRGPLV